MKIHNTLTGTTELFKPSGNTVSMYVCGITPYSPAHVGHAMRSVVFDVSERNGHARSPQSKFIP